MRVATIIHPKTANSVLKPITNEFAIAFSESRRERERTRREINGSESIGNLNLDKSGPRCLYIIM